VQTFDYSLNQSERVNFVSDYLAKNQLSNSQIGYLTDYLLDDCTMHRAKQKDYYNAIDKSLPVVMDYYNLLIACDSARERQRLKHDLVCAYEGTIKPIKFIHISRCEYDYNMDWFDFGNPEHVYAVLTQNKGVNLTSNLGVILFDVQKYFYQCKPSKRQIEVYKLLGKYNQNEIAQELCITPSAVSQMIRKIVGGIVRNYIQE
jgi:predicted DNA-binding protein YlxM (UPF0122 family)